MTAPTPLRLEPADYPPPHGPDCAPCPPCDRLRRQVGVVRMRTTTMNPDAFIVGGTPEARSEFAEQMREKWNELAAWHREHGPAEIAARCALWAATWETPYGETIRWKVE